MMIRKCKRRAEKKTFGNHNGEAKMCEDIERVRRRSSEERMFRKTKSKRVNVDDTLKMRVGRWSKKRGIITSSERSTSEVGKVVKERSNQNEEEKVTRADDTSVLVRRVTDVMRTTERDDTET